MIESAIKVLATAPDKVEQSKEEDLSRHLEPNTRCEELLTNIGESGMEQKLNCRL